MSKCACESRKDAHQWVYGALRELSDRGWVDDRAREKALEEMDEVMGIGKERW